MKLKKVRPGIIVSIIGLFCLTLILITQLSIIEKAIIGIVCSVVIIFGILSETNFFDKFINPPEEFD